MTVLFLRLSSLRDTAASSTHRVLADLVHAAAPDAELDFAFLPPKRTPRLAGVFSGRPLADFDLILVINSFVQESLNLPWLLHANGLSPWAETRPETAAPILFGGSNAFAAQCLVRPDGTAVPDALFFGEAEISLPRFIARWRTASGRKRERLLQAADGLDGFWVTGAPPAAPVRQAVVRQTPPPPAAALPLLDTEFTGTARLTVGFGCAAFCAFCFEGYERKPYREHAAADLLTRARSLKQACGARTVELDAFNLNHYKALSELVIPCSRLFEKLSFKSQRADGIAACPELIDLERAAGKSTFTLGIEGISSRLRAFLAKALSDREIADAIDALLGRRVREIKLFFILTAYETPDDLAAFDEFCIRLRKRMNQPPSGTRVVLSFGRLVRMPNTPLAADRLFLKESDWRFAVDGVAAVCRRARLECRFAFDGPDYVGTQLLAACGHEAADAVVRLACEGLSYHGPWRPEEAERLRAAIGPATECAGHGAATFPFVRRAVSGSFLQQRWEEARQAHDEGYCLGAACRGCGACASPAERQTLTDRIRTPPVADETIAALARIEADKRRLPFLFFRTTLPAEFSGHSASWASARLMQMLLAVRPDQIDNLLSAEEAVFSVGEHKDRHVIPSGETVVRVKVWDQNAFAAALRDDSLFTPRPDNALTAGSFAEAVWEIRTGLSPRDAARLAGEWLMENKLPHTLRRDQDGWRLELAPAAIKKRVASHLEVSPENTGSRLRLTFSPKAQIRELLARLPNAEQPPRLRCVSLR